MMTNELHTSRQSEGSLLKRITKANFEEVCVLFYALAFAKQFLKFQVPHEFAAP